MALEHGLDSDRRKDNVKTAGIEKIRQVMLVDFGAPLPEPRQSPSHDALGPDLGQIQADISPTWQLPTNHVACRSL